MALLPSGPYGWAFLALVVLGTAFIAVRRDVPKAYALGVLCFAVYALQFAAGAFGGESLVLEGGFSVDGLLAGAWWSPLTSMYLHAGFFHLFGNLFVLLTAGPALEDRIGSRRFLVVYFAAGVGALLAHTAIAYAAPAIVDPADVAIGASGAIFGVLTAVAVRYPRLLLPTPLMFIIVRLPAFVVLLIHLGFNLAYLAGDQFGPGAGGIAWWGHFAGFLVGLPFAYMLPARHEEVPTGTRGLPDPAKLEPLATTPELRALLDKVHQFSPDARTSHDSTFALAWVDRFLEKARCPACGRPFARKGLTAVCEGGETRLDLRRA